MAFNAQSYYRNQARRRAKEALAEARALKQRVEAGEERWPGEGERLASRVDLARHWWRSYLGYLRLDRMDADMARFRRGDMTYDEFMAKWKLPSKEADDDFQR